MQPERSPSQPDPAKGSHFLVEDQALTAEDMRAAREGQEARQSFPAPWH